MTCDSTANTPVSPLPPHFDGRSAEYARWREQRLRRPAPAPGPVIELPVRAFVQASAQPDLPHSELAILCRQVRSQGFACYRLTDDRRQTARLNLAESQLVAAKLASCLGMYTSDDGVMRESTELSVLQDQTGTPKGRFIPYTNKRMNWHTDGYYNSLNSSVRCFTLHCVQSARQGGALSLMDPELLLIALYDDNPEYVAELARSDAMTLPANSDDLGHNRPDRTAPVIFCHADGALGLRFTTRTENIHWRSEATARASQRAAELIAAHPQWHKKIKLQSGEGIVARNVLHAREAYTDTAEKPGRMILRGRFLQIPVCPPQCTSKHAEDSCPAKPDLEATGTKTENAT